MNVTVRSRYRRKPMIGVALLVVALVVSTPLAGCRRPTPADAGPPVGTHWLVLPDGNRMTSEIPGAVGYRDLSVRLEVIGIGSDGNPVSQAIGNHAELKSDQPLTITEECTARLAVVDRTEPAAAGSTAVTREYWVLAVGADPKRSDMRLAYAIVATVTGNEASARDEVGQLVKGWSLPGVKR